jgi:uncharacterized membrane protein YjgN (DUF898 family)
VRYGLSLMCASGYSLAVKGYWLNHKFNFSSFDTRASHAKLLLMWTATRMLSRLLILNLFGITILQSLAMALSKSSFSVEDNDTGNKPLKAAFKKSVSQVKSFESFVQPSICLSMTIKCVVLVAFCFCLRFLHDC